MKMLGEKLSTTIYEADTTTRRRQIEAPRIDLRSTNPMVVHENCLVRAMEMALARMPLRACCLSQKAEFATNADVGTMNVSQFTSRIHDWSGGVAMSRR